MCTTLCLDRNDKLQLQNKETGNYTYQKNLVFGVSITGNH